MIAPGNHCSQARPAVKTTATSCPARIDLAQNFLDVRESPRRSGQLAEIKFLAAMALRPRRKVRRRRKSHLTIHYKLQGVTHRLAPDALRPARAGFRLAPFPALRNRRWPVPHSSPR